MAEFKIASGYVDVSLRDSTEPDLDKIRERLARTKGASLPVGIRDDTSRGLAKLDTKLKAWVDRNGQVVTVKVDTRGAETAAVKLRAANLAVEEATAKATAAQEAAAEVAKKVERGELDEAEAKKQLADAARAVEKAQVAQALATAKASEAADKLSTEQSKLSDLQQRVARDADLASRIDLLGMQKAAGNRKQYNTLLRDTEAKFGDLKKITGESFSEMETLGDRALIKLEQTGQQAFDKIGESAAGLGEAGPLMLIGIPLLIASLPALSTIAAGAITLGLGGALSAVGIMAVASAKDVQKSWGGLAKDAKNQVTEWAQPWRPALDGIAKEFDQTVGDFGPTLNSTFAEMAPTVQTFAVDLSNGFLELRPAISEVGSAFDKILAQLGPQLPTVMHDVSDGIVAIAQAAGDHAEEFVQFVLVLAKIVEWGGKAVQILADIEPIVTPLTAVMDHFGIGASKSADGVSSLTEGVTQLKDPAEAAKQAVNDLDDAVTKFLDPELAVTDETIKMQDGFDNLAKKLKASHGELGLQTQKQRDSLGAFKDQIKNVTDLAQAQAHMDGNTNRANKTVQGQIDKLWKMAGTNKTAQDEVERLAALYGATLPKSAQAGNKKVDQLRDTIAKTKGKTITMNANVNPALAALHRLLDAAISVADAAARAGAAAAVSNSVSAVKHANGALYAAAYANGGIRRLEAYANGEDHTAQIAPAGAMRLWAEPETGGEAYIPLAPGKRARSTGILGAVAARFGLVLAKKLADGGIEDDEDYDGDYQDDDDLEEAHGGVVAYRRGGISRAARARAAAAKRRAAAARKAARAREVKHDAGAKLIAGITSSMLSSLSKIQSYASSVNSKIQTTFSGATETRLLSWAKGIEAKMESASTKAAAIADQIKAAKDYAASTTDTMKGTATLSSLGTIGSAADITSGLGYRLGALQGFSQKIEQLAKAGLNKTTLQQVIDAGPDQGSAIADMLLKSVGSIKTVNSEQSAIDKAATTIGNNAADAMYDSGKDASKGFLSGLYGQQAELNKLMASLGEQLAGGLAKAFGVHGSEARAPVAGAAKAKPKAKGSSKLGGKKSGNKITKHAAGGYAAAGELALVGEQGPELVQFGAAGHVYTAAQTADMMGGGVTIQGGLHVHVTGTLDLTSKSERKKVAEAMVEEINSALRSWDKAH